MSLNQLTFKGNTPNEQRIIETLNQAILGNTNNTATVTLTANAASTTVSNSRIGANSYIEFMPTTANAATEKAAGSMYVSSRSKGEFVITHANNAQTDRTFTYAHIG
jgi:hypothetical protein